MCTKRYSRRESHPALANAIHLTRSEVIHAAVVRVVYVVVDWIVALERAGVTGAGVSGVGRAACIGIILSRGVLNFVTAARVLHTASLEGVEES